MGAQWRKTRAAVKPALKRGAVFAYIVQHTGKARLIGRAECSTERCRHFARACQMLRNRLRSAILGNVRKIRCHTHLEFCNILPT